MPWLQASMTSPPWADVSIFTTPADTVSPGRRASKGSISHASSRNKDAKTSCLK